MNNYIHVPLRDFVENIASCVVFQYPTVKCACKKFAKTKMWKTKYHNEIWSCWYSGMYSLEKGDL